MVQTERLHGQHLTTSVVPHPSPLDFGGFFKTVLIFRMRLTLKTVVLMTVAASQFLSTACKRKPPQPTSPVYERVVRVALPHDLNPHDSVACIGAHNDKGELYDLGCNEDLEQDPMVGMFKATFSENPGCRSPHAWQLRQRGRERMALPLCTQ
jgi:hypothetical protein